MLKLTLLSFNGMNNGTSILVKKTLGKFLQ